MSAQVALTDKATEARSEHEGRRFPSLLREPEPVVFFRDFGDSALLFELRVWFESSPQNDRVEIESGLRHRIVEVFAEHAIEIAFPQLDVHLDVVGGHGPAIAPGTKGGRPASGAEA